MRTFRPGQIRRNDTVTGFPAENRAGSAKAHDFSTNGNNPFRPERRLRAIFVLWSVFGGHDLPSAFADARKLSREFRLAGAILQLAPTFPHFLGHSLWDTFLPTQML
jgi:hypothetical protein